MNKPSIKNRKLRFKIYNLKFKISKKGFTLIELIVALVILTLIGLFSTTIYLNYTARAKDLKAANLVYEEGRFLMEKIVREVRQNAIDYEEYYNQNSDPPGPLGDNYCLYDLSFYSAGIDGVLGTIDDESLGARDANNPLSAPLENPIQSSLYLINTEGTERIYLGKMEKDFEGEKIGKVGILKLKGEDFGEDHLNATDSYNGQKDPNNLCQADTRENDGLIDTWLCEKDFPCNHELETESETVFGCTGYRDKIVNDPLSKDHSFVDISPNAINVVDLKFIISPKDDPRKAYKVNEVQIQPYVTIQLTVKANPKLTSSTNPQKIPQITLTSTVTTRNYTEVPSPCI